MFGFSGRPLLTEFSACRVFKGPKKRDADIRSGVSGVEGMKETGFEVGFL